MRGLILKTIFFMDEKTSLHGRIHGVFLKSNPASRPLASSRKTSFKNISQKKSRTKYYLARDQC